jgi:hypothetical protein
MSLNFTNKICISGVSTTEGLFWSLKNKNKQVDFRQHSEAYFILNSGASFFSARADLSKRRHGRGTIFWFKHPYRVAVSLVRRSKWPGPLDPLLAAAYSSEYIFLFFLPLVVVTGPFLERKGHPSCWGGLLENARMLNERGLTFFPRSLLLLTRLIVSNSLKPGTRPLNNAFLGGGGRGGLSLNGMNKLCAVCRFSFSTRIQDSRARTPDGHLLLQELYEGVWSQFNRSHWTRYTLEHIDSPSTWRRYFNFQKNKPFDFFWYWISETGKVVER